jgi:acyl carrier protein
VHTRALGYRDAEDIQAWLTTQVAQLLGVDPASIDPTLPFAEYGLGSREALELSGALEEWLGERLSPTLAWDYPTVELLAAHLAQV